MAKKEKFTSGSYNLDSDLDLGNFDFGDEPKTKIKDDRSPVTKAAGNFAKGSIGGMKSAVTNSATIAKAIRAGMPKEYGEVVDRTGEVTSQLSGLYNDANAKIKPEIQKITKQIDKLVPEEMKRTKSVLGKIKKALGVDDSSYRPESEEERNEGNIQSNLAEVFSVQAEDSLKARAEDRAERKLDKKVDAKRFESSFGLLNSINVNMARMSNYTTKVNSAFQKKSLELQYRSYYVQQDTLKATKQLMAMLDERTAAIQKNTGLPDFVKRHMSEDFKEMTRRKLIGSVGGFMGRGIKNLATHAKGKMDDYLNILQQASMGLDMAVDAKDMMKSQKEMSEMMGEEDLGKAGMVGDLAGGAVIEKLIKKFGKKLNSKYFQPGSKQSNALFNILSVLNNGEQSARDFQKKHLQQDFGAEGFKGTAKNFAKGGLSDFIDIFLGGKGDKSLDKQFGSGLNRLHESAEFNQLTQKSITTIIPGFLSRIHGEIRALRTNKEPGQLLQFNAQTGKFDMSGKVDSSIRASLQKSVSEGGMKYGIDKIHDQIAAGGQLSADASEALRKKLHHHTFTGIGLDVDDLKKDDFTKGMDINHAREIREAINKRYDKNDASYAARRSELTKAGKEARESIVKPEEQIQKLIDAGHAENLVRLDIIEETSTGYNIKPDAVRKLSDAGFKEDGLYKTSDLFSKTDIKNFSGAKALNAIKNTKVFNWLYKKGKGDGAEHVGPMAQDVRRNFGDETAPGGKAIDVVSMNGATMAAVQELDKKVKDNKGGRGATERNALVAIDKNTAAIVERLDNMAMINFGIPKLDMAGLKEAMKNGASKVGEKFSEGKEYLSEKAKMIKAPEGIAENAKLLASSAGNILGSIINKAFDTTKSLAKKAGDKLEELKEPAKDFLSKSKDKVMDASKWFFEKGTKFAGKVFDKVSDVTTDIIQNKLPAGWAQVLQAGKWLGGKLKNIVDTPIDIYVTGREKPALRAIIMRAGGYLDQITKKPIKNPSDIKGPVIDVDGNIVLSVDDIEAGIHDVNGKPIDSITTKIKSAIKNFASGAAEKASALFGKFKGLAGQAGSKAKDLASKIHTPNIGILAGVRVESILTQIRDVLNMRLPGKRMKFPALPSSTGGTPVLAGAGATATMAMDSVSGKAGELFDSAKDKVSNLVQNAKESKAFESGKNKLGEIAGNLKGSKFGSSIGGLFGKLGGMKGKVLSTVADKTAAMKHENSDEFVGPKKQGLLSKIGGALSGFMGKGKSGGEQSTEQITDPHQIHAKEGQREGGVEQQFEMQAARERKRKSQQVATVDNAPRYKSNKNIFDSMADAAKGAFGMVMNGLGSLANIVFGGGKVAGLLGTVAKGALSGAGMVARGALSLGGTALRMGAGAVARFGAGAVLGGLGGAVGGIAGTAVAAGGALLTALSSPVVLGGLAVAAAGYGLYKGYKFLTRNKASAITKVRMMQYGLRNEDSSHNHEMFNLESELLQNGIVMQGRQFTIAKQKMNLKNILDIFDLSEEQMGDERGQNFITWFNQRFKTVFLTHLNALYAVDPKFSLAEIDTLYKDDKGKFDRYFKVATSTPDVYASVESPFEDLPRLQVSKEDVDAAINAIRNEYKDDLDENGNEKESLLKTAAKGAFGFLTKNEGLDKIAKQGGFKGFMAKVASFLPGVAIGLNLIDTGKALGAKLGVAVKRFFNQGLSALEAVRFKTYGLKKLNSGPVSSLRNLEDVVSTFVSLGGSGTATFNGDVNKIIKEVGSDFGLSSASDEHAASWMKWFSNRFLPTFLNFMGSGFQLSGKKVASEIESALKEKDKYDLAVRISGTSNVWSQDVSPWKDEPDLCVNPDDCKDNLALLKEKAGNAEMEDPKVKAAKAAANANTIKSQMVDKPKPASDSSIYETQTPENETKNSNNMSGKSGTLYDKLANRGNSTSGGGSGSNAGGFVKTAYQVGGAVDVGIAPRGTISPTTLNGTRAADADSKQEAFKDTTPGATAGGTQFTGNRNDIKGIIADAASKTGVDPNTLLTFGAIESSLNPNAKAGTSSASGLFQFISSTWKSMLSKFGRKYNLDPSTSPTDPVASALMGGEFIKQNAKDIASVRPNPSATDLYLAHFLGSGGAKKFLSSNPSDIAANIMPDAANANKSIFFNGARGRTIAEVYNFLNNKVRNTAMKFGINLAPSSGMATNNVVTAPTNSQAPTTTSSVPEGPDKYAMEGGGQTTTAPASTGSATPSTQPPRTTGGNVRLTPPPVTPRPLTTAPPTVSAPPTLVGSAPTPQIAPPRTNNMNVGGADKAIANIDTTMTESLNVQKKMLDFMQQIASNTANAVASAAKEAVSPDKTASATSRSKTPEPAPRAPISLERRSI